jgi:predicted transcriptional regulator
VTGEGVDEEKRATLRRFAALGTATPLAGLTGDGSDAEPDGPETREAVFGYVTRTPGAHFSKVRDDLRLGTGEAQYHLRRLVEADRVESRRDGDYRRFYPAGRFSAFERVALGHLRRETPRGILLALLRTPGMTGAALARELDVSAATVSTHAGDLADAGLLVREDGYRVRRPETVLTLVVAHADSLGPAAARLAADAPSLLRYDPEG